MGNGPDRPTFGRRGAPRASAADAAAPAIGDVEPPAPHGMDWTGQDAELEDWKRSRQWQIPWRQISLTASLCFGVASLVLPDNVNESVQWLLYGLAAISLYSGLRKRRL